MNAPVKAVLAKENARMMDERLATAVEIEDSVVRVGCDGQHFRSGGDSLTLASRRN